MRGVDSVARRVRRSRACACRRRPQPGPAPARPGPATAPRLAPDSPTRPEVARTLPPPPPPPPSRRAPPPPRYHPPVRRRLPRRLVFPRGRRARRRGAPRRRRRHPRVVTPRRARSLVRRWGTLPVRARAIPRASRDAGRDNRRETRPSVPRRRSRSSRRLTDPAFGNPTGGLISAPSGSGPPRSTPTPRGISRREAKPCRPGSRLELHRGPFRGVRRRRSYRRRRRRSYRRSFRRSRRVGVRGGY